MRFRSCSTSMFYKKLYTRGLVLHELSRTPNYYSLSKPSLSSTPRSSNRSLKKSSRNYWDNPFVTQQQAVNSLRRTGNLIDRQKNSTNSAKSLRNSNSWWSRNYPTSNSLKLWESPTTNSYKTRRSWCFVVMSGMSCVAICVRRWWRSCWKR